MQRHRAAYTGVVARLLGKKKGRAGESDDDQQASRESRYRHHDGPPSALDSTARRSAVANLPIVNALPRTDANFDEVWRNFD